MMYHRCYHVPAAAVFLIAMLVIMALSPYTTAATINLATGDEEHSSPINHVSLMLKKRIRTSDDAKQNTKTNHHSLPSDQHSYEDITERFLKKGRKKRRKGRKRKEQQSSDSSSAMMSKKGENVIVPSALNSLQSMELSPREQIRLNFDKKSKKKRIKMQGKSKNKSSSEDESYRGRQSPTFVAVIEPFTKDAPKGLVRMYNISPRNSKLSERRISLSSKVLVSMDTSHLERCSGCVVRLHSPTIDCNDIKSDSSRHYYWEASYSFGVFEFVTRQRGGDLRQGMVVVLYSSTGEAESCGKLEYEGGDSRMGDDSSSASQHMTLISRIVKYPGYDGSLDPKGDIHLVFNDDDTRFLIALDVWGLSENSCEEGCAMAIHAGSSCQDIGEIYWKNSITNEDNFSLLPKYFIRNGRSTNQIVTDSGHGLLDNIGRVVILYGDDRTPVGCGIIQTKTQPHFDSSIVGDKETLHAKMGVYPDYTGVLRPNGYITVMNKDSDDNNDKELGIELDVNGLMKDCKNCGVHIHDGKTCEDAASVGGHYWNTELFPDEDVWDSAGAVYTVKNGQTLSKFALDAGTSFHDNSGRTVVMHDEQGERFGCGILRYSRKMYTSAKNSLFAEMDTCENYDGPLRPQGLIAVEFISKGGMRLHLDMTGLDMVCNNNCRVEVTTSTMQDNTTIIGDAYYTSSNNKNPWKNAIYRTVGGTITSSKKLSVQQSGYDYLDHIGHQVIVRSKDSSVVGCGYLRSSSDSLEGHALYAPMGIYEDYTKNSAMIPTGEARLQFMENGKAESGILISLDVVGLNPDSKGRVVIRNGICSEGGFGDELVLLRQEDPIFRTDEYGRTTSEIVVRPSDKDYYYYTMVGKIVTLHTSEDSELEDDVVLSCGTLRTGRFTGVFGSGGDRNFVHNLVAFMTKKPGYEKASIEPRGIVNIRIHVGSTNTVIVKFESVYGLDARCAGDSGCVFHVHTTADCEEPGDPTVSFPNNYFTSSEGVSNTEFVRKNDFGEEVLLEDYVNKTLLLHDSRGRMIACGILHQMDQEIDK